MKKHCVLLSAAFLLIAAPVIAGSGEKCSSDIQTCLNHWAAKKDMGWVGLEYDKTQEGTIKVKAVTPDSPAAAAGFMAGDVLVAMNGAKMSDKEAMKKAKGDWKVGQAVSYTVQRAGAEKKIAVTLGKAPESVFASMVGNHMLENHATVSTAAATEPATKAAVTGDKR